MIVGFIFVGLITLVVTGQEAPKDPEGKTIFVANKCNSCHSIESVGLKKKPNQKPPDLSNVGSERNAEWIMKYVQKKETIDGVKHLKAFTGKAEELKTLAGWLESLKIDTTKTQ